MPEQSQVERGHLPYCNRYRKQLHTRRKPFRSIGRISSTCDLLDEELQIEQGWLGSQSGLLGAHSSARP